MNLFAEIYYAERDGKTANIIHVTGYDEAVLKEQQVLDVFKKYDKQATRATQTGWWHNIPNFHNSIQPYIDLVHSYGFTHYSIEFTFIQWWQIPKILSAIQAHS